MSPRHSDRLPAPTPWHRADRDLSPVAWLTDQQRWQIVDDLDDLPILADTLNRHYDALLAAGSRNPDDPWIRYPIAVGVLDLADRRLKGEPILDPIGEADLARRIGQRRHGILPTLVSWVSIAVGEMADLDLPHRPPADPDRIVWEATDTGTIRATRPGVTVASEAAWLLQHLDWIAGQQWVTELATDIRTITADLKALLGPAHPQPDDDSTGTIPQIAAQTGIPARTLWRWAARGWLTQAGATGPRSTPTYFRREAEDIRRHQGAA